MTTAERIESKIERDPATGCWLWQGHINPGGYGRLCVNAQYIYAHRVSYELFVAPIPAGMHIDHKCHVKKCVNPYHLRVCTDSENSRNIPITKRNKSGFKGVSWHTKRSKWRATIRTLGKYSHLGYFDTPEEAYAVYCREAITRHGEFANLGAA